MCNPPESGDEQYPKCPACGQLTPEGAEARRRDISAERDAMLASETPEERRQSFELGLEVFRRSQAKLAVEVDDWNARHPDAPLIV